MNEECINCEWYNKPYWSIISPCTNCTKRFKKKSVTVTHYSIDIDKKELYKEIEQLQQKNQQLEDRINKVIEYIERFDIKHLHECMEHNLCDTLENLLEILKGKSE